MVRISVEVTSGAASFRVSVRAESIERALEIVRSQNPGREVCVVFPIDPEIFFAGDRGSMGRAIGREVSAA